MVGSLSSLISKQSNLQEGRQSPVLVVTDVFLGLMKSLSCFCLSVEEMHAEICYAECLLQKATLTFVQVTNNKSIAYFIVERKSISTKHLRLFTRTKT